MRRPDAEEALARAKLAAQSEAAEIMRIDQPKVLALVRGRLSRFSTDKLFRCLVLLGQDEEADLAYVSVINQNHHGISF